MSPERRPAILWRTTRTRLGTGTGQLEGEECPACGRKVFPPRDICPSQDCRWNIKKNEPAFKGPSFLENRKTGR